MQVMSGVSLDPVLPTCRFEIRTVDVVVDDSPLLANFAAK
jgi:hypothetical protein